MKSLLITNGHLVTLDAQNRFIENGSILVEGNHIIDVGQFPADKYKVDRSIDARGSLVMPGLINAHHHLYSTFARGFTPPALVEAGQGPRRRRRLLLGPARDHACGPRRLYDDH
jgi:cytosine/adenosine deaminase-related metal-dependent hydrolase